MVIRDILRFTGRGESYRDGKQLNNSLSNTLDSCLLENITREGIQYITFKEGNLRTHVRI